MLKADGFDKAIIGYGRRCGQPDILIYDYEKCIKILMKDMPEEDAREYMEYNVVGAWVGPETPIFLDKDWKERL